MSIAKPWQEYARTLKELFSLDYSPVGVSLREGTLTAQGDKKVRICRAILDAGRGQTVHVDAHNNACFGASWHLGFRQIKDPSVMNMVRKFVVEGEKLFCSYEALDALVAAMPAPPDTARAHFVLAPMEASVDQPDIVIFVANAEASCRILTFVTFFDGRMPALKIGGPTCRLSIIAPLTTGEVNISFYDYTARKMCNVEKDKLLVSLPYRMIPSIVSAVDKCSAGTAPIEFPPEFRQFLQKHLGAKTP